MTKPKPITAYVPKITHGLIFITTGGWRNEVSR